MMIWPPIPTPDTRPTSPSEPDPRVQRVRGVVAPAGGKQGAADQNAGKRGAGGDRRRPAPAEKPGKRRLFDAVVDALSTTAELDADHTDRLRSNLRKFVATGGTTAVPPLPPDPTPVELVAQLAPDHPSLDETERAENARLAQALRQCLALHTDNARKISVYLHALLAQTREEHQVEVTA